MLGRSGNLQGEIYRVGFPRSDLHVTVGAVRVRPSLALGSWVAFKQTDDSTVMLMGELVLLPAEVGSVINALQRACNERRAAARSRYGSDCTGARHARQGECRGLSGQRASRRLSDP